MCFCGSDSGCDGGMLPDAWDFIQETGVVTGAQQTGALRNDDPFGDGGAPVLARSHSRAGPRRATVACIESRRCRLATKSTASLRDCSACRLLQALLAAALPPPRPDRRRPVPRGERPRLPRRAGLLRCVRACVRWPCAGEVAEHTVRQDSPSCPKKCDSNATAPHNVFADDKYALRRSRSPGGPCVVRDSLLNATGSECAVQCTARRRARRHSDGVQRYTFTGGEVSTFEDEE